MTPPRRCERSWSSPPATGKRKNVAAGKSQAPGPFIAKWRRASELKARLALLARFVDLCRLLGEPPPDSAGETCSFERGARKDIGGAGWADGWRVALDERPVAPLRLRSAASSGRARTECRRLVSVPGGTRSGQGYGERVLGGSACGSSPQVTLQ